MIPDVSIFYNKADMHTLLYTNYHTISSIDLTLQSYLTSTQIEDSYYTKNEIDSTLSLRSPSATILDNFYSKLCIGNLFLTSAQTGALNYTKTDTGNLLANKVSTTGDVSISGNLDVGVDASSSKVDVHCNQHGYTAVTELHSQSPWISKLEFLSTHPTPRSFIFLKGSMYFEFNSGNQTITHYKSLVNGSDDRLKGK